MCDEACPPLLEVEALRRAWQPGLTDMACLLLDVRSLCIPPSLGNANVARVTFAVADGNWNLPVAKMANCTTGCWPQSPSMHSAGSWMPHILTMTPVWASSCSIHPLPKGMQEDHPCPCGPMGSATAVAVHPSAVWEGRDQSAPSPLVGDGHVPLGEGRGGLRCL